MKQNKNLVIVLCCVLFYMDIAYGKSIFVSNKAELDSAVLLAKPGDSIVVKNKIWNGVDFILTSNGTAAEPITICAETPSKVFLEGGSRIEIGGDYLVVSGFTIRNGSSPNNAVVFKANGRDANHSRLTNCLIDNWGPSFTTTKIHWVRIFGSYNRVDHCQFSNMYHPGATVFIKAGADQIGHHKIDYNSFGPKPQGDGNGYESIKMGSGEDSMYPLYSIVEKNYFTKCDGEVELISNKSWENTYRHNTFYECEGTITLRWGRKCVVEGNYFIGNGLDRAGGVRITDQDHLIINNYFENLKGKKARAAISIMSGIPDAVGGDSGHSQTKNARILHNTMVNCRESINIGYFDKDNLGDPRGPLTAPENCTIANNIIVSTSGTLIEEDWAPSINTTWLNNITYGTELGITPNNGLIEIDPKLALSSSGIWRLKSDSPAINSGTTFSDPVLYDFELQSRVDTMPDIGADELSNVQVDTLPVGPEDVGPNWNKDQGLSTYSNEFYQERMPLQLYPNPASQSFNLSLASRLVGSEIKVEIINMSGSIVYSEMFFNTLSNQEIIVNHLQGLYIVRVQIDEEIYHSKIIFK